MEITLSRTVSVIIVPEQRKEISKITVLRHIDSPSTKTVLAITKELGQILLWEGEDYDEIGQWTDADVENKIKELYDESN